MKYAKHSLALALLLVLATVAHSQDDFSDEQLQDECNKASTLECNFQKWQQQYNIYYSNPAQTRRHKFQYCKNCVFAKAHRGSYTMKLGRDAAMNFSQISEYRQLGKVRRTPETDSANSQRVESIRSSSVSTSLPTSLDYSNHNGKDCRGPIKDQGRCGSCWAFAATAFYESFLCVNGFDYVLSDEACLECTSYYAPNQRDNSCDGGYMKDPLLFYSSVGGVKESNYPYVAGGYGSRSGYPTVHGICTDRHRIYLGQGTVTHADTGLTKTQIKTLLVDNGPLMVGIYANTGFSFYSSGVYNGCPSYSSYYLNHAVLLYGYTADGNWLIKNSWGTDWGINGTMILSSAYDCGISTDIAYITVSNKNTNVEVNMTINV